LFSTGSIITCSKFSFDLIFLFMFLREFSLTHCCPLSLNFPLYWLLSYPSILIGGRSRNLSFIVFRLVRWPLSFIGHLYKYAWYIDRNICAYTNDLTASKPVTDCPIPFEHIIFFRYQYLQMYVDMNTTILLTSTISVFLTFLLKRRNRQV